jgi:hypothetical protein
MSTVRITGRVVRAERKSGTSKAGNPYSIREARVMIGEVDFADVSLPDDMPDLRINDQVDVAAEYTGEFKGQPSFRVRGDWHTVPGVNPDLAVSSK